MSRHTKIITLRRIIKAGTVNFGRNLSLAIAAMAVMVVTLTGVLLSVVAGAAFNHSISDLTSRIDISMYITDDASTTQVKNLVSALQDRDDVKSATYISKDEALAKASADDPDDESLQYFKMQGTSPLPASIRIQPVDPNNIQSIKSFLDEPQNAKLQDPSSGTSYSGTRKEAIDNITHATNLLVRIGIVAIVIFGFVSVLIIFNTIQMAIFNRRDELTIMRLLGASNSYIRGPFIVESALYGIIAAGISVLLIHSLFLLSSGALQASTLGLLDINYAATYFRSHFWVILLMQLGVGILIGAASSYVATKRYLKFKTK